MRDPTLWPKPSDPFAAAAICMPVDRHRLDQKLVCRGYRSPIVGRRQNFPCIRKEYRRWTVAASRCVPKSGTKAAACDSSLGGVGRVQSGQRDQSACGDANGSLGAPFGVAGIPVAAVVTWDLSVMCFFGLTLPKFVFSLTGDWSRPAACASSTTAPLLASFASSSTWWTVSFLPYYLQVSVAGDAHQLELRR